MGRRTELVKGRPLKPCLHSCAMGVNRVFWGKQNGGHSEPNGSNWRECCSILVQANTQAPGGLDRLIVKYLIMKRPSWANKNKFQDSHWNHLGGGGGGVFFSPPSALLNWIKTCSYWKSTDHHTWKALPKNGADVEKRKINNKVLQTQSW